MSNVTDTIHGVTYTLTLKQSEELKRDYEGDSVSYTTPFIDCDVLSDVCANITMELNPLTEIKMHDYIAMCQEVTNVELAETWQEDNTFLLRAVTTYFIHVGEGYILIDNRKYRFELEDLNLSLDMDGDWISTHMLHSDLVCNANSRIGRNSYKKIKILGEL